jgi:Spy/CpxP family protein refolding chaperone
MMAPHRAARALAIVLVGALLPAMAAAGSDQRSPYAGQERWEIKSLSPDDLAQLRAGQGWGLAKAAELNGLPGPLHVLALRQQLDLGEVQASRIDVLYREMNEQARALGIRLIEQERRLDETFARGEMTPTLLRGMLTKIAKLRGELRFVHLNAHLAMMPLLRPEQIAQYNQLRGYDSTAPGRHDKGHHGHHK